MMHEVVDQLSRRVGIRGVLVMTRDGVLVAARLGDELEADAVAAMAAEVCARARAAATSLGLGAPRRVILSAGFGRLILMPFEEFVLVVVTRQGLALDRTLLEIAGPAQRIHHLATNW